MSRNCSAAGKRGTSVRAVSFARLFSSLVLLPRLGLLFGLLVILTGTAFASTASAYMASWPATDVTVTLPASEGSESDAYLALFRDSLAAKTGKAVSVRRIPGQAGGDAWAKMADDAPDGSVLTNVLLPNLILRTYAPESGVYPQYMTICHIGAYSPCVLWAPAANAIESVASLAETIRSTSGNFMVAGPGRFSAGQIAARAFDRLMGVKTLYIPYAGSVEAAKAALNRQATVFWGYSTPPSVFGSSFKALAVASENRLASMPDVPTFRELGIDLVEGVYLGVAVPSDVSEFYRDSIGEMLSAIAKEPAYLARASAAGFVPLDIDAKGAKTLYMQLKEAVRNKVEDYSLTEQ